jgi:hypothetical protein
VAVLLWAFGLVQLPFVVQCARSVGSARSGLDFGPKPPPKPGSSISHTRLCECLSCEPPACCAGADETQSECQPDAVRETATEDGASIDFGSQAGAECGIAIRTCTSQCAKKVWRVALEDTCDTRRPSDCCG